MYSKEEAQRLKQEFWITFAQKYPRKWILYDTKIKDFSLKFYVDNKKAQVSIDIEHRSNEKRKDYFEKIVSLKNILDDDYIKDLIFENNYVLDNGKTISRIWIEKLGVGFSNKSNWDSIFDFFYEKMDALELFYAEFGEYIRDLQTNS